MKDLNSILKIHKGVQKSMGTLIILFLSLPAIYAKGGENDLHSFNEKGSYVNFDKVNLLSYGNFQENGLALNLTGNLWKSIPVNQDIKPNTVLVFEFRSDQEGYRLG